MRHQRAGAALLTLGALLVPFSAAAPAVEAHAEPSSLPAVSAPASPGVASSPFERLWRPFDPSEIPFRYRCDTADTFTATDLAGAAEATDVPEPLAEAIVRWGGQLGGAMEWHVVSQVDDRVLALSPAFGGGFPIEELELVRTISEGPGYETWAFAGGGDCRPEAVLGRGIGGRWRLDPGFPAPGPKTRTLHVLGYAGCNGTEKTGPARIHATDEAMLIAIPMGSTFNSDACAGLGPTRMTVRLPEPLGDRELYDAGSLPIRRVGPSSSPSSGPSSGPNVEQDADAVDLPDAPSPSSQQAVLSKSLASPAVSASPEGPSSGASSAPSATSFPWPTLPPPDEVTVPARFEPKGPPDVTRTKHGVRVDLWLSSPSVAPGEWVQALVRTTNLRDKPVYAWANGCQTSGTSVSVDLSSVVPSGETQTGNAADFKREAIRGAMAAWFEPWRSIRRSYTLGTWARRAFIECTPMLPTNKLGPGASRDEHFAWYPASSFDEEGVWFQPLPPGPVRVSVSWPFISRGAPPTADSRSLYRMIRPIRVTAPLELTGDGPGTPSVPELVDSALADPEFRAWVDAHPARDPWPGVSVIGFAGPTYEHNLWLSGLADPPRTGILVLEQDRGVVDRGAVFMDPWTGEVLDVWFLGPSFEAPVTTSG